MRLLKTTIWLALTISPIMAIAAPSIQVIKAKWSGKDVSSVVAASLNGSNSVTYQVSRSTLGLPARSRNLNFELQWKCESGLPDKVQVVSVVENSSIKLECTKYVIQKPNEDLFLVKYPNDIIPGLDPAVESTYTEKLLRYTYSFHQMLQDPARDNFEKSLKPGCVTTLRKHLSDGHTFYVPEIGQATIRADKYSRLHPEYGTRYFHRTKSGVVLNLARNQDFHSMYQYVRQLNRDYFLHLASIFVSDHPTMMDKTGPYLIEIVPKADAKILVFPGVDSSREFQAKIQAMVHPWIESRYPELLPCYRNGTVDELFTGNAIDYLALESSGAEWVSHGAYGGTTFFFILNPFSIKEMAQSLLK